MIEATHEHEFEAAPGLPEPLPPGEKMLWQGAPEWQRLALHAFHVGKLTIYFLIMLAIQVGFLLESHASSGEVTRSIVKSLLICLVALAILSAVAWFSSKTAVYTITDKRVVMRVGIVLTLTFNLPHKRIAAAAMKNFHGSVGDIALTLYPSDRIAWMHLWPHARAWRLSQPEPALRCIKDADKVGNILLRAWSNERVGERAVTESLPSAVMTTQPGQGVPA